MQRLFNKNTLRSVGISLVLMGVVISILLRTGALLNPLVYNNVLMTTMDSMDVDLSWLIVDEPVMYAGICPMQDGDRLYYDDETKEWQTSQGCTPASVEQDGESFVSLSSNSIYQFEVVEASDTDSHFSSMTFAPFCDMVILIGEEVTGGIQLHNGCDTELGVDGDSVFTVEYTPAFGFEY